MDPPLTLTVTSSAENRSYLSFFAIRCDMALRIWRPVYLSWSVPILFAASAVYRLGGVSCVFVVLLDPKQNQRSKRSHVECKRLPISYIASDYGLFPAWSKDVNEQIDLFIVKWIDTALTGAGIRVISDAVAPGGGSPLCSGRLNSMATFIQDSSDPQFFPVGKSTHYSSVLTGGCPAAKDVTFELEGHGF